MITDLEKYESIPTHLDKIKVGDVLAVIFKSGFNSYGFKYGFMQEFKVIKEKGVLIAENYKFDPDYSHNHPLYLIDKLCYFFKKKG